MLKTTQTIYSEMPFVTQEISFSAEAMPIDWFLRKNLSLRSDVIDLETKQQIVRFLRLNTRQMSRIRRLSISKLKG